MSHQEVEFRTYFIRFFLPIIVCLLLVVIMSQSTLNYYYNLAQTPPPAATPVQPNKTGSNQAEVGLANMLIYVLMAFIGGVIILYLIRKGLFTFVQVLFGGILGFSAFFLGLFFYSLVLSDFFVFMIGLIPFLHGSDMISFLSILYLVLVIGMSIISGILGFVVMIDVKWVPMILRNGMIILFGAAVGSYLGIHFPVLSAVFVLIGLAIYDIYAVFKGPLKGILKEIGMSSDVPSSDMNSDYDSGGNEDLDSNQLTSPHLDGLPTETVSMGQLKAKDIEIPESSKLLNPTTSEHASSTGTTSRQVTAQARVASVFPGLPIYSDGIISIGLGDFAFYSMLVAQAMKITWLLGFNIIPLALTLLGVLVGALITLRWLVKQKVLPGLPMAVFLGIIGLFAGIIIAIPSVEQMQWLLSQ